MEDEANAIIGLVNFILKKKPIQNQIAQIPWKALDSYPEYHFSRDLAEGTRFKMLSKRFDLWLDDYVNIDILPEEVVNVIDYADIFSRDLMNWQQEQISEHKRREYL